MYSDIHAPQTGRRRVRAEFRTVIGQRYGAIYTRYPLALRRVTGSGSFFAPIIDGPGNVPVFFWPAVLMDENWLEPAPE